MIVDYIENADLYYGISESVKEALNFLRQCSGRTEPVTLESGTTVKILPYETLPEEQRKWEAHDHLIDIHYAAEGTEDMLWASRRDLAFLYKEDGKDVLRYEGEGTRITLKPGMFAIVFPDDVHKTKLAHNGIPSTVLKGIVKINL